MGVAVKYRQSYSQYNPSKRGSRPVKKVASAKYGANTPRIRINVGTAEGEFSKMPPFLNDQVISMT